MYPLKAVNIERSDYVPRAAGELRGGRPEARPGAATHAVLSRRGAQPAADAAIATRARHGQDPQVKEVEFAGRDLRNAEVYDGSFLIEACFRLRSDGSWWPEDVGSGLRGGDPRTAGRVRGGRRRGEACGGAVPKSTLVDGRWRHLVVEADRPATSCGFMWTANSTRRAGDRDVPRWKMTAISSSAGPTGATILMGRWSSCASPGHPRRRRAPRSRNFTPGSSRAGAAGFLRAGADGRGPRRRGGGVVLDQALEQNPLTGSIRRRPRDPADCEAVEGRRHDGRIGPKDHPAIG